MTETDKPKNLLDLVKERCRYKHFSLRTEQSYCSWIKRFILFHHKRHLSEIDLAEVTEYLSYLANKQGVSSTRCNKPQRIAPTSIKIAHKNLYAHHSDPNHIDHRLHHAGR